MAAVTIHSDFGAQENKTLKQLFLDSSLLMNRYATDFCLLIPFYASLGHPSGKT